MCVTVCEGLWNPTQGQIEPRNLESATQRLHTVRGRGWQDLAAWRAALARGGDRRAGKRAEPDQYGPRAMPLARELTQAGCGLVGRACIADVAAVVPDDRLARAFDVRVRPLDRHLVQVA